MNAALDANVPSLPPTILNGGRYHEVTRDEDKMATLRPHGDDAVALRDFQFVVADVDKAATQGGLEVVERHKKTDMIAGLVDRLVVRVL